VIDQAQALALWFHGTDKDSFANILEHGFIRAHNWFAIDIPNAKAFGGSYVLGVLFDQGRVPANDEDGSPRWQMCVEEYISPDRIQVIEVPKEALAAYEAGLKEDAANAQHV